MKQVKMTKMIVSEFANPKVLLEAAKNLKSAGYEKFETYSPFPVHGMDRAMGLSDSRLGWIVIISALVGGIGGFFLEAWTSTTAYRLVVSGKPFLSTEAFVPVIFELTILFSAFSTVIGLFALNKLPTFYHAIFKHKTFYKASSDGFFISVDSADTQFDEEKTVAFLKELEGENIEVIVD